MMDCKKALIENGGDVEKALDWLRAKGIASAEKKADRTASEGIVDSYVHNNKVGVMLEVNCETDFVARNNDFKDFVKDVSMHIAAMAPAYISRDDIPQEVLDRERAVQLAKTIEEGKPEQFAGKIVDGRMEKWFQ